MQDHHKTVTQALENVEAHLRDLSLWESEPPPAEALASTQPFAVDTLTFPQWLQFIFIPRLHQMARDEAQLPGNCNIAPMAEEHFKNRNLDSLSLIRQLRSLDQLLSGSSNAS